MLGIIAALPVETRCLTSRRIYVGETILLAEDIMLCVSGMGAQCALAAAQKMINSGVTALISWGTAGGLAPHVRPGQLFLPNYVMDEKAQIYPVSQSWRERLWLQLSKQVPLLQGTLFQSVDLVISKFAKGVLYSQYQAVGVDMESAAIAAVASSMGKSFLSIRAIVDTCEVSLPNVISRSINSQGQLQPWLFARKLCTHPKQWLSLLKIASSFYTAKQTLKKVVDLTETRFAWQGSSLLSSLADAQSTQESIHDKVESLP